MEALHRVNFAGKCLQQFKGTTACGAINHMCVVLDECDLRNPSKKASGCLKITLGHQGRGYTKVNPPTKHQKAFPS
eukprot:15203024-Ditylum_brightwellii.AAC.1